MIKSCYFEIVCVKPLQTYRKSAAVSVTKKVAGNVAGKYVHNEWIFCDIFNIIVVLLKSDMDWYGNIKLNKR